VLLVSRVIVEFDSGVGLGNIMFMNAFGYIISRLKECDFYPREINFFKNTYRQEKILNYKNPLYTRSFGNHFCDMNKILNHKGDIIINSFLQKQIYYTKYRQLLRSYYNECVVEQDIDTPTLYIRNGDYKDIGKYLGREYYVNMLDKLCYGTVNIVTNHIDQDVLYLKDRYNSTVISGNIYEDFLYLCRSKELILSQSTFAWWPAFLNDKQKTVFPLLKRDMQKGFWYIDPGKDDIDLFINNEQNFFYL
jgi:hypothetical protein